MAVMLLGPTRRSMTWSRNEYLIKKFIAVGFLILTEFSVQGFYLLNPFVFHFSSLCIYVMKESGGMAACHFGTECSNSGLENMPVFAYA